MPRVLWLLSEMDGDGGREVERTLSELLCRGARRSRSRGGKGKGWRGTGGRGRKRRGRGEIGQRG